MTAQFKSAKIILALFLILQVMFWFKTYEIKPKLNVVPPLPSNQEIAAISFGDPQLYFRAMALNLQMAGDTFGRSTPLKDYNYPNLLKWFRLLDRLDEDCLPQKDQTTCRASTSNYVPSMAAYYFSKSQRSKDVAYVLDYLEEHSMRNPEANWWWLSQSIYLANSVLRDKPRAIRIASELHKVKAEIPLWASQMEVFLREDMGEKEKAEEIMCETFQQAGHLKDAPKREQDFMIYFFQTRMNEALHGKSLEQVAKLCVRKYPNLFKAKN